MPLQEGKSNAAVSHNVETEMNAGKPQKQAVAIALKTAGKSNRDAVSGVDAMAKSTPITDAVMSWGRSGSVEITPGGPGDPAKIAPGARQSTGEV